MSTVQTKRTALKIETLSRLVSENTRFLFVMNNIAEKLHGAGHISAGLRTILLDLETAGPRTVPDMARLRNSSRQYIQSMVNHLLEKSLVEYQANARHKRSKLVALTDEGRSILKGMLSREAELGEAIVDRFSESGLETTLKVMQTFRETLTESLEDR